MQHKTHALHISNREMKLEEEQVKLVNQYKLEIFVGEKESASITLQKAAEVNAEFDKERNANEKIAALMVMPTHERDLIIQQYLLS